MAQPAFVTIVTRNYLPYARAWREALRTVHPQATLYICLVDQPPAPWKPEDEAPAQVVLADELRIPDWPRMRFQYRPEELACALKPHALGYAMQDSPGPVIYLDADIQACARFDMLLEELEAAHIVLTPHLLQPLPTDAALSEERRTLNSGAYNGGIVGLRRDGSSTAFLDWWRRCIADDCVIDNAARLFLDQGFLDFVPALFDSVRILRHPGYNVAHWNLDTRILSKDGERLLANGEELACFHFTGYRPEQPDLLTAHRGGKPLAQYPACVKELADAYHARLKAGGLETCSSWEYAHSRLSDGTPIPNAWRDAVRTGHPALRDLRDFFDVAQTPGLAARYQEAARDGAPFRMDDLPRALGESRERYQRIATHPVLGRLLRGWRRWLNPEL